MVFVREAHIYRRITFIKDLIYTNNISDIRKDRKISQDKMAEEIGISRRTLSKIENSDQNLS
ncbi:MAG: helix-turn-helix transcriptional regulator, partial [Abditibacteriota bacterium]|nr:helix-turn-helix transcriptional regulator [Abditibacteriota bacterium]